MSKWVVVPGMRLKPYRCVACGSTPRDTSDEARPNLPAFFCEGVDVNWGDSLYLCDSCVNVLGRLRGMVDVDEHEKLKRRFDNTVREYDELQEEHRVLQERIDRMLDGVKAKKEAVKARQKKAKEPVNA